MACGDWQALLFEMTNLEVELMKVGILTITNGENYGNRLQNYAVQYVLESLGCEVETIRNTTEQRKISKIKVRIFFLQRKLVMK